MFIVRRVVESATLAAFLIAGTATAVAAEPEPGARRGFRLFAGALGAMTVNRVYCGFSFGNHSRGSKNGRSSVRACSSRARPIKARKWSARFVNSAPKLLWFR